MKRADPVGVPELGYEVAAVDARMAATAAALATTDAAPGDYYAQSRARMRSRLGTLQVRKQGLETAIARLRITDAILERGTTMAEKRRSKYVSYTELATLTGYSRSYLRVLKARGEMPPTVHPEYPVWTRKAIEAWLAGRGAK